MPTRDKKYEMGKTFALVKLIDSRVVFEYCRAKDGRVIDKLEIPFNRKITAENYFRSVTEKTARLMIDHNLRAFKK